MDCRPPPCDRGVEDPVGRCSTVEHTDKTVPATESCPDCHALVTDLEAHKLWHRRVVADIATAVEKETKRRSAAAS